MSKRRPAPPGWRWIFTPYITKNGKKIWAKQYGKRCFAFLVREEDVKAA